MRHEAPGTRSRLLTVKAQDELSSTGVIVTDDGKK